MNVHVHRVVMTKLTAFLKPKPPPSHAYTAFTGLPVPTGGSNSGWGSPAWSPKLLTDDNSSSPSGGYVFFSPNPTLSLHFKWGHPFQIVPPSNTTRMEKPTRLTASPLCIIDATTHPKVLLGPDPTCREGSIPSPPPVHTPLFFLGTDDKDKQSHGVMVDEDCVEESDDKDNIIQGQGDNTPTPPLNDPIDIDKEQALNLDDAPSPSPTQSHHKHKILFMFDDVTGDFEDPHPTIFLPRCPAPQEQNPHRSTHPHISPVDQDAMYLKTTQGSKPLKVKKDKKRRMESLSKKDVKGKEKELVLLKCARNDNNDSQPVDMPAAKKLKSKDATVDKAEVVCTTPAIRKYGPALSKPPAMSMGISGGGFGEKIPSTAKPIKNGLKSISVLVVEEDYGKFVKVDGQYWNKDVAPFIGECYTEQCDTLINTFESALNAIEVNNTAVTSLSLRLHECLNLVKEVVADDEDSEVEEVAEGVTGLSKKKKSKSG
ncbi:hypothetical protein EV421DRAFT_1738744 [Armillaria borealis]|uniref:Uncharacterized protein n=1 Tax=Armillaria borealis TaxID=47425 RepID=A0AA39J7V9_9AGAR|nr:hypothetical protein EV421DRAFT_1738744 [Armillaria borealis]